MAEVLQSGPVEHDRLLEAIQKASSRAINGEPDPATIAEECPWSRHTILRHLGELEDAGKIERHDSLAIDTNSTFKTAVVIDDEC